MKKKTLYIMVNLINNAQIILMMIYFSLRKIKKILFLSFWLCQNKLFLEDTLKLYFFYHVCLTCYHFYLTVRLAPHFRRQHYLSGVWHHISGVTIWTICQKKLKHFKIVKQSRIELKTFICWGLWPKKILGTEL